MLHNSPMEPAYAEEYYVTRPASQLVCDQPRSQAIFTSQETAQKR